MFIEPHRADITIDVLQSMLRLVLNVRVSAKLKCPSGLAKYLLAAGL
jgi:hypothetical protein